jgi:hypothetical protein
MSTNLRSSVEVKNMWSYNSIPPRVLNKYNDNIPSTHLAFLCFRFFWSFCCSFETNAGVVFWNIKRWSSRFLVIYHSCCTYYWIWHHIATAVELTLLNNIWIKEFDLGVLWTCTEVINLVYIVSCSSIFQISVILCEISYILLFNFLGNWTEIVFVTL